MAEEIHVGDIGTAFEVTIQDAGVALDISTATALVFWFRKPDASIIEKTPVFSSDGTDGKLRYYAVNGDLDLAGGWQIQARVTLPTGSWSTSKAKFTVYGNLK